MAYRPLNLGQIDPLNTQALQLGQPAMAPDPNRGEAMGRRAGRLGLADALNAGVTRPLQGGGWGEALARGAEAFLRARGGRAEHLERLQQEQTRKDSLAEALAAFQGEGDPETRQRAVIAALARGAPEEGMQMAAGRLGDQLGLADALQQERDMTPVLADRQLRLGGIENDQAADRQRRVGGIETDQSVDLRRRTHPYDMELAGARRAGGAAAPTDPADTITDLQDALRNVDQALGLVDDGGGFNQNFAFLGGNAATNLQATIEALKAQVGFGALQRMREASRTGGALGSITEREIDLLAADIASLDPRQGDEQLTSNLNRVRGRFVTMLSKLGGSLDYETTDQAGAPPAPAGDDIDALVQRYRSVGK